MSRCRNRAQMAGIRDTDFLSKTAVTSKKPPPWWCQRLRSRRAPRREMPPAPLIYASHNTERGSCCCDTHLVWNVPYVHNTILGHMTTFLTARVGYTKCMLRGLALIGVMMLGFTVGYYFGFDHGNESALQQLQTYSN